MDSRVQGLIWRGWDQILRVQRGGDKALKYKLDVKGQITEML
jgi:hypothetical protein